MTGLKNKLIDLALKVAVLVCVGYSAVQTGKVVRAHIPPYKVGTCLRMNDMTRLTIKIEENSIIGGYSTATICLAGIFAPMCERTTGTFSELRTFSVTEVECPKDEK